MNDVIKCKNNITVFSEEDMDIAFQKTTGKFMEIGKEHKQHILEEAVFQNISKKFSYFEAKEKSKAGKQERMGRLTLLTTQGCNLRCKYCFAHSGTYGVKKEVKMSFEVMKDAFLFFLGKFPKGIDLVHFFGGEPMLAFDSIEKFVPWCLEYCRENSIVPPVFSVVTNGTIMNPHIFAVCNKYKINFVVSVDGNKELNDLTRVSPAYESVYDIISSNFQSLSKERNFNIGCELTINKNHVRHYKKGIVRTWLDEIEKLGFEYAIVGCAETDNEECALTPEDKDIFFQIQRESIDYFFERFVQGKKFLSVEIVGMIRQMAMKTTALPCGAGYHSLTITPNGDISPCYQFYQDEDFNMGNIYHEDKEKYRKITNMFMDNEKYKPDACKECWLENECSVLCKGFGYNTKGGINQVCESRCWIYEVAFRRIIWNLLRLSKDKESYHKFITNLYDFNKQYLYNK